MNKLVKFAFSRKSVKTIPRFDLSREVCLKYRCTKDVMSHEVPGVQITEYKEFFKPSNFAQNKLYLTQSRKQIDFIWSAYPLDGKKYSLASAPSIYLFIYLFSMIFF